MISRKTSIILQKIISVVWPILVMIWIFLLIAYVKFENEDRERRAYFDKIEAQRKQDQEFNDMLEKARQSIEDYNNKRNRTGTE